MKRAFAAGLTDVASQTAELMTHQFRNKLIHEFHISGIPLKYIPPFRFFDSYQGERVYLYPSDHIRQLDRSKCRIFSGAPAVRLNFFTILPLKY